MKVLFQTSNPNSPAVQFYRSALENRPEVDVSPTESYSQYDIALFFSFKRDLEAMKAAKLSNPNLVTGLIDPRGSSIEEAVPYVDFFIIDSLETQDFIARYKKPFHIFHEYPPLPVIQKEHRAGSPVIIGYHGNRVHLASAFPALTTALEELNKKVKIELWAAYNLETQGKLSIGLPKSVPVRHIQWTPSVYTDELSKCDIGIAPNLLPIRAPKSIKSKAAIQKRLFLESQDDYLLRFKIASNPGRILVFGHLGIPVVSDFYPSALQTIKDGHNGFLACSAGGWYRALELLAESPELRQTLADRMTADIHEHYSYQAQTPKLMDFLREQRIERAPGLAGSVETYIAESNKDIRDYPGFWREAARAELEHLKLVYAAARRRLRIGGTES